MSTIVAFWLRSFAPLPLVSEMKPRRWGLPPGVITSRYGRSRSGWRRYDRRQQRLLTLKRRAEFNQAAPGKVRVTYWTDDPAEAVTFWTDDPIKALSGFQGCLKIGRATKLHFPRVITN